MFDGILFDLDGTLWDSTPQLTDCWNEAIALHGSLRPPLTVEEVRSAMGLLLGDIAQKLLPGLSLEMQATVINECVRMELPYLAKHGGTLFPNELETLAALQAQCPLFVVSNCEDGYIESFYEGTGLGHFFTDHECAGRTGKPKAENIALVVARHGLQHPVYIGDTPLDHSSAVKAGVPFLHAAYGFGQAENVPAAHSFADIPAVLKEMCHE